MTKTCKYGHEITGDNVYAKKHSKGVYELCRQCHISDNRIYRSRKKLKASGVSKDYLAYQKDNQ
jgi:peptide methionine sulfoxide reductase MsrB